MCIKRQVDNSAKIGHVDFLPKRPPVAEPFKLWYSTRGR
jgi:hypothetical protein